MRSILPSMPPTALKQLAAACRESNKPSDISCHVIEQIVGSQLSVELMAVLRKLNLDGWSSDQVAFLMEEIARAAELASPIDSNYELVLSGPDVAGVHVRDTFAVVNELFMRARREVLLVGYAVHNGQVLFHRLAQRFAQSPDLRVRLYLDIPRRRGDSSLPDQIVRRFGRRFFARQWPWKKRPEVYYDVRSLGQSVQDRSSLHAKCVIVDSSTALVTSANFTSAAQERNIEAGVLVENRSCVAKLLSYLEGLEASGVIQEASFSSVS